jgi:hypothetical protein
MLFSRWDRLVWILFSRWWPQWRDSLIIVQPDTVLPWHREGRSAPWRYRALASRRSAVSKPSVNRPSIRCLRDSLKRRRRERRADMQRSDIRTVRMPFKFRRTPVKAHHAATLALLGWAIIIPPMIRGHVDTGAPISEWDVFRPRLRHNPNLTPEFVACGFYGCGFGRDPSPSLPATD